MIERVDLIHALNAALDELEADALVITGLDELVFKNLFETGHKLFFGLLLAVVIVWAPSGLLGKGVAGPARGGKR